MPRVNKHKQNKIPAVVILSILGFIAVIALLIILTMPNRNDRMFDDFVANEMTHDMRINRNKFDRNNSFRPLNQRQLMRQIGRDEVSIVLFGTASNANTFQLIQELNGRFNGFEDRNLNPHPIAPSLVKEENLVSRMFFHNIAVEGFAGLVERINERTTDDSDDLPPGRYPLVAVFRNNEVILIMDNFVAGEAGVRTVRDFFIELYEVLTES
jgi:hypothetical protein